MHCMNTRGGRKRALDAVERLSTGGQTNLSGGLFGCLDQLEGRPVVVVAPSSSTEAVSAVATTAALNDVTSVWLFTDGEANVGIQVCCMLGVTFGVRTLSTFGDPFAVHSLGIVLFC